jgi:hypothetical protein
MTTILQLAGLPDTDEIPIETTDETGRRRFLDLNWISPLLEPLDPARFRHLKLLYGGAQNPISVNITPDIVYNSISDPERCRRALERAEGAVKNNPYPVINTPANIARIRPDRLSETVAAIQGLSMPRTLRLTPHTLSELHSMLENSGLETPILLKEAAADPEFPNHYLLESYNDIHDLERFAFDGRAYYASAFADYRDSDGLYRLHRFYVIGETVLPGHLIISDQWYIRGDEEAHRGLDGQRAKIVKEEKGFPKRYRTKKSPALTLLKKKLGLDYYAADCALDKKGNLLLLNVKCDAHYADGTKAREYFDADDIRRFNRAVETMLLEKSSRKKASHA